MPAIGGPRARPMTQSLFNWSQDLERALYNAGTDNGEIRQALIEFCEESLRRISGIRIGVNWSVLLIVALLAYGQRFRGNGL